jgi:hypothetical protein
VSAGLTDQVLDICRAVLKQIEEDGHKAVDWDTVIAQTAPLMRAMPREEATLLLAHAEFKDFTAHITEPMREAGLLRGPVARNDGEDYSDLDAEPPCDHHDADGHMSETDVQMGAVSLDGTTVTVEVTCEECDAQGTFVLDVNDLEITSGQCEWSDDE